MDMVITSTTDSKEAVIAAQGGLVQKETVVEQGSDSDHQDDQDKTESTQDDSSDSNDHESDDSTESDDLDEIKEDEKPKKKMGGFQKRIEKFKNQLSAKDQEIESLRQQVSKAKPEETVKTEPIKEQTKDKPKPDDFDTHEDYIDALTDYKIEAKEKLNEQKNKANQLKTEMQKQIESFQSKVSEFSKSHNDFEDVMADVDDIILSPSVQESIISSEYGPSLMYELAKNKSELERINKLSPLEAARAIGKFEARLSSESESIKKEIKTTTKAPQPIKVINSGSAGSVKKSPDDMSFEEYKAWRKSQK